MENSLNLSDDTLSKIDEVVPKYPEKRSAALMVIHLVQDELGAIDDVACEWIAGRLELQPINIKELITFYPMLREKPWGRKHVRVCRTLPCALRGSYGTCKTFEEKLGVKEGHVSEDGEYSIEFMECLADCGQGPVVIVDEKTYENIDGKSAEKFADLLIDGKLDESEDFLSYEDSLTQETKN
ncbi:NAD(P)H-dependent oxidoreductase subunit E [Opitutales bacterium]|jgi:NADH-quinone oxidoreductase subunit E|nr:NAD(P)H-dependent oxidoreductase subunit E [Opitutales bacterium]